MSDPFNSSDSHRRVRSYVLREGRMTPAQERALQELWPRFGIDDLSTVLDLDALFGRSAPRVLEIGFGRGDALVAMATAEPETDFLGVEVHRPGIGHLLNAIAGRRLTNVRVCRTDAAQLLENAIADGAFQRVLVLFPDPWPKRRHRKRRLVTHALLARLAEKMVSGGELLVVTDSESYGRQIAGAVASVAAFRPAPFTQARPAESKYEQRALRGGHAILEFSCRKI